MLQSQGARNCCNKQSDGRVLLGRGCGGSPQVLSERNLPIMQCNKRGIQAKKMFGRSNTVNELPVLSLMQLSHGHHCTGFTRSAPVGLTMAVVLGSHLFRSE